jgi:hypothetical protein
VGGGIDGNGLTSWPGPNGLFDLTLIDRGPDGAAQCRDLDDDEPDKNENFAEEKGSAHQQNGNSSTVSRTP